MFPFDNKGNDCILVDDNLLPHRSQIVTETVQANNVNPSDEPTESPDIKLFEHVWSYLKFLVRTKDLLPENLKTIEEE